MTIKKLSLYSEIAPISEYSDNFLIVIIYYVKKCFNIVKYNNRNNVSLDSKI